MRGALQNLGNLHREPFSFFCVYVIVSIALEIYLREFFTDEKNSFRVNTGRFYWSCCM